MSESPRNADEDRIREALRESEERYRFLAENIPVQVWTALPDGGLDYVTEQTASAFGLSAKELLASGWEKVVHPEDLHGALDKWLHSLATGEPYEVEFRLKLADGSYSPHLARAVAQKDSRGEIVRWFGTNTNISEQGRQLTERQQLLRELEAKQAMLDSIIQQMPAGVIAAESPSGKVLFSNQKLNEILSNDAVPAGAVSDYSAHRSHYPDGRRYPVEEMPLMRATLRGESVVDEELHYRRADGTIAIVRCNSSPIRDKAGALIAGTSVFNDVTASKKLERQRDELLVREQLARSDAEQASRAKDEFLATASHELRSPLSAILGWARMLRTGQLDQSGYFRAIETIERNAKAQVQLIDDILDGSRIITGNLRLDILSVDLHGLLQAALDAVRPAAEAKQINLKVQIDPDASRMLGDPERLQQVMWNLANNAIKFTQKGGNVDIRLQREGTHIQLIIRDDGQGIAPEFLPYVFDRFRQAEGTTTRRHGGLGLGLALVRHLVEAHGGTVSVESEGEGQGAAFKVNLPVQAVFAKESTGKKPAAVAGATRENFRSRLSSISVLVVDDEADARDLVATVLRASGAEVNTAANAAQGLALIESKRPMVIVSDVGMPLTDGYQLMRSVRRLADTRAAQLPALALTAYSREEDRRRALEAGFTNHIAKPVEPEELVRLVAALVLSSQDNARLHERAQAGI